MMVSYHTNRHQSKHYYLEQLESNLKSSIFGQDEAITQVVNKIMINKAGLSDTNKPVASLDLNMEMNILSKKNM